MSETIQSVVKDQLKHYGVQDQERLLIGGLWENVFERLNDPYNRERITAKQH